MHNVHLILRTLCAQFSLDAVSAPSATNDVDGGGFFLAHTRLRLAESGAPRDPLAHCSMVRACNDSMLPHSWYYLCRAWICVCVAGCGVMPSRLSACCHCDRLLCFA